jgi:1,4-alpha-glucan branching enzyme
VGEGPDPVTLGEYLARHGTAAVAQPAASSWGEGGYNEAWLRPETGWVYLQLQQAGAELQGLVRQHLSRTGDERAGRVLRQAARSLLLAQSSDWTFHLGQGGATDYARTRLRNQLARVRYLVQALRAGEVCERRLGVLERMDNLFPDLDLAHFS